MELAQACTAKVEALEFGAQAARLQGPCTGPHFCLSSPSRKVQEVGESSMD